MGLQVENRRRGGYRCKGLEGWEKRGSVLNPRKFPLMLQGVGCLSAGRVGELAI
jgi:hypothetical protein